jgi:hypothetical protein
MAEQQAAAEQAQTTTTTPSNGVTTQQEPKHVTVPADFQGPESAWVEILRSREAKRTAQQAAEQAREAARAAQEQLEALQTAQTDFSTKLSAAEKRAAELEAKYQRDTTLLEAQDIPQSFRHPRMRQRLWDEFQGYRAEAGEEAMPFSEFITSDYLKEDPAYAPHFERLAATQVDEVDVFDLPDDPEATAADAARAQTRQAGRTGTHQRPVAQPIKYTAATVAKLKAQGLWKVGRVDVATGELLGGSKHWQAYMRQRQG